MRKEAEFRFYEELNDFLTPQRRKIAFMYGFSDGSSVKNAIEALGVPHTEVDLILVNGVSVGFDYRLGDGDRVSVYPVFESLDIGPVTRLRDRPLREPSFVLDGHLGTLARLLRMLGFDARYRNDFEDREIIRISVTENRIVLTCDRGILKTRDVTHGYCLRSRNPNEQVREVLDRFDLHDQVMPFRRCLVCNGTIRSIEKSAILDRVPPRTAREHECFYTCEACGKVYWEGSHYAKMKERILALTAERP